MKALIIIPAYNEQENIIKTCNEVKNLKIKGTTVDYIVINDASKDDTKKICIENNINFIDLPCNLGIGGAVQTGYKYAYKNNYDIAIQFDGDGQHDAGYIKDLIEAIKSGGDLIIGSRYISDINEFKSTPMRRMGSNILKWLIRKCVKQVITDPTSGFRACNTKIIKLFATDYPIDYPEPETIATVAKKGYIIKEIPVEMNERIGGISSINTLNSVYYMIKVCLAIILTSIFTKGDDK